ncbi:hypothetical protein [Nonlabens antarcticus]|uniref:hypothetical protein n=1 Tax=Nonlabens antarcticus TaxID=392714 RepID=UPI001890DBE9|nr:hypothetical protein [Nonlabens antarcticus]
MMENHKIALEQLITTVKARNGKPVNMRVVVATIESMGIRDIDIVTDYGFESITAIADYIFTKLSTPEYYQLKNKNQQIADKKSYDRISINSYITGRAGLFVKDYSTGIFHLFPVVIQIAAIIFFGFSLWTFVGFNDLQSTAVVFGVILGLVGTGGLVQVVGKQVSFYWYNQDYPMTYYAIKQLLRIGVRSLFVVFLIIAVINSFIRLYPFLFIAIVFVYALLIGFLLLAIAPLYTIKQRWMISVSILAGTLLSLSLFFYSNLHVYIIHWIGIMVSALIALLYLYLFFKKLIRSEKGFANKTPKFTLAIYRNINYFFYGTLIYIFVFMDRLVAWSSHTGRELPYVVYYESDYEIGMDLAIIIFFLLAGVLEYNISAFSRFLDFHQRTTSFLNAPLFNKKMSRHYFNQLGIFFASGIASAVLLYLLITQSWGYEAAFADQLSDLSLWVCAVGGVGYFFLTLGMLNVLYLYTLNRNKRPVLVITVVTAVNLVVGAVLSRLISYEYAVVGMLVGSLLFAILTTIITRRFFNKLDYYYYAAY